MNSTKTPLSFGHYLQSIRLEKGISLEDVSKETRIRIGNLLLIEKEDHENLPAQIFVKGFLRAYAKAIGADDKEAIRRYEDRYSSYQKVVDSEVALVQLKKKVWSNLRFALGITFCLIVISVYGATTIYKHSNIEDDAIHQKSKIHTGSDLVNADSDHVNTVPITTEERKNLLLKVTAVKDTWMKVIVDGQSPESFSLSAGDRLEFEAFSGINLLVGDASGVNLLLNNEPYEVTGDSDQAVNIQIP